MLERRNSSFSFKNEKELISFFTPLIPKEEIKSVIQSVRDEFKKRADTSEEESKFQFLKKAECILMRLMRTRREQQEEE